MMSLPTSKAEFKVSNDDKVSTMSPNPGPDISTANPKSLEDSIAAKSALQSLNRKVIAIAKQNDNLDMRPSGELSYSMQRWLAQCPSEEHWTQSLQQAAPLEDDKSTSEILAETG